MAETTRLKLPYPTASEDISLGPRTFEAQAKLIDELMVAQNLVAHSAGVTAKVGELLKMTATATVTLPAVANNAIVGVICASGETTIKTASGDIYGDFITGTASIRLALYQHVILQSDGTNWYIIAGEPKNENRHGKLTEFPFGESHSGSATRPTEVVLQIELMGTTGGEVEINIGGAVITVGNGEASAVFKNFKQTISFTLRPGDTWALSLVRGEVKVFGSYREL